MKEGELLDPDFDIRNVCFNPLEFIRLVNGKSKKLKRGSVIVYDEVQVTMSAQDFQSLQAKLINACLQTFRFRGFILFMTSPYFQFVNKSARKLFHSRWETVTIDHDKKQCVMKPFLLQTNQESGDTYRKYLRIWTKETGIVPYKRMKIGLASEELRREYETRRQQWSNNTNEQIEQSLMKAEEKEQQKHKELTPKQEQVVRLLQQGFTIPKIAEEVGIVERVVYDHIKLIKKKGVKIIPIKEDSKVIRYDIKGYDTL